MQLTSRLALMNWLTGQGLTGLPENELLRGFCERCRAEGLELSRGLVVIDTLHPIYEGRGFRWSDRASNESDAFEYGSTAEGDANKHWLAFVHRFGENGALGLMDCLYSCWTTRRDSGFTEPELVALRDLVPVL